jgi:hypothetical protein
MKIVTKMVLAFGVALFACVNSALAVEVGGMPMPDTIKTGGKELKLNGYGVRTAMMGLANVYSAGLYFTDQRSTAAEVLSDNGPKAVNLVMLMGITSDKFGAAFMKGFRDNTDKAEMGKLVEQVQTFGEMFEAQGELKKGDVLTLEYTPGVGTNSKLNGKPILANPLPDVAFMNAILRIWLGDKPVQPDLKEKLLNKGKSN